MDQNKELAMFSLDLRMILSATIAAVAISCLAPPQGFAATSPGKSANITFTASGTFASTPVSGADTLKLAGQPFTISVVGNSSLKPVQHGQNWAIFKPLQMTGNVFSGLIPDQAIPISSTTAAIDQTIGSSEDIFQAGFPVVVVGIALNVRAYIPLPGGTLSSALLRPFSSIPLGPTATVTYSNSTAATVLAVQTGTMVATLPTGGVERSARTAPSTVVLIAGAQAVRPRSVLTIGQ
jgi:hypothetical protein